MATANLNSPHPPLQYRIGQSDRTIGGPTAAPDGFSVLNLSTGKVFVAQSGVWTDGGSMPTPTAPVNFPQLLAMWYATNSTNLNTAGMLPALRENTTGAITGGAGYRICNSDRVIGAPTNTPNGFIVLNKSNNNVFQVQSGVWAALGVFPADLMAAWLAA